MKNKVLSLQEELKKELDLFEDKLTEVPKIKELSKKHSLIKKVEECNVKLESEPATKYPPLYFFLRDASMSEVKRVEHALISYKKDAKKESYNHLEASLFSYNEDQSVPAIYQLIVYGQLEGDNLRFDVDHKVGKGNHNVDFYLSDLQLSIEVTSISDFGWYKELKDESLSGQPKVASFNPGAYVKKIQGAVAYKYGQLCESETSIIILGVSAISATDRSIQKAISQIYDLDPLVLDLFRDAGIKDPEKYIKTLKRIILLRYQDRQVGYHSSYPCEDFEEYGLGTIKNI